MTSPCEVSKQLNNFFHCSLFALNISATMHAMMKEEDNLINAQKNNINQPTI